MKTTELDDLRESIYERGEIICPADDSSDVSLLGTLGKKAWIRCDACGWEFSVNVKVEPK